MSRPKTAKMFFDGGCHPNPGQMDIALIFKGDYNDRLYQDLSYGTNNIAEWYAILAGLEIALNEQIEVLEVVGDSELVIKQINGEYRVKNKELKSIFDKCDFLRKSFKTITFNHIPREQNLAGIHIEQMRKKD